MTEIHIEYIRPGKDTSFYVEDLVFVDARRLKTFKLLPPDVVARLNRSLIAEGLIAPHQRAVMISKTYFFDENFNLLAFCDEDGNLLGYYSDIGTPLIRTEDGYRMTDWFLDIWLDADGTLIELDLDEFEEAITQNLLSRIEIDRARTTFARLIEEVKKGIYPYAYR